MATSWNYYGGAALMWIEELHRVAPIIGQATFETFWMVIIALTAAAIVGVPIGVLLVITRDDHILGSHIALRISNLLLNAMVNLFRAIPFVILLFWIMPVTRAVAGVTYGIQGALFPLIVYTIPFIARVTESAILEVQQGIIEAFVSMGATPWQIVTRALLRESRSGLILALTTAAISLTGATAMAGAVGAGGLGDTALRYGYQNYDFFMMNTVVIVLIMIVQGVQSLGSLCAKKLRK